MAAGRHISSRGQLSPPTGKSRFSAFTGRRNCPSRRWDNAKAAGWPSRYTDAQSLQRSISARPELKLNETRTSVTVRRTIWDVAVLVVSRLMHPKKAEFVRMAKRRGVYGPKTHLRLRFRDSGLGSRRVPLQRRWRKKDEENVALIELG